ncbi:L-threonylcarbamoyladenylate synthase [Suttonella sp. R2A3]|uniref:L-threonylcarbamoyladenylate synthase n=1 Tax=Suttonella sp. R2A3 TaxID=2908648 RepID=UPI0021A38284|nr:Sua5/YciO/YrdC/YwlC family protein [Suttonella sp. R2A3]
MSTIKPWPEAQAEIVAALRIGSVIAYPTEAVYGLGGDAANAKVIDGVLRLKKGRDPGKGVVLVVGHWQQAAEWVSGIDDQAWQTMQIASQQRATTFILPPSVRVPTKLMHREGGLRFANRAIRWLKRYALSWVDH